MCEAIQKMRLDSRLEGERIGKELGKIDAKNQWLKISIQWALLKKSPKVCANL